MADTVKLPGIGDVKTTYVYVGGALVAGIVGYAWWSRRNSAAQAPVWDVDSVPETEYNAPGGGSSNYTGAAPEGVYTTNTQWSNAALSWFQSNGYDPITAALAIARYLAKKPLNVKEQEFLQVVTAQVGEPPTGGPWKIIPETSPAPATDGILPNLTRPGYGQMPNALWRFTYAREGETYYTIASRVFDWPKNGMPADPQAIVRIMREINDHIKTPEPQAGDLVAYR